MHNLYETSFEGRPGRLYFRGEKGVPRCGGEKVINFGNVNLAVKPDVAAG